MGTKHLIALASFDADGASRYLSRRFSLHQAAESALPTRSHDGLPGRRLHQKGTTMFTIRRSLTVLLTGFALAVTALLTGAADVFARPAPPDPVSLVPPAAPATSTVSYSYGSPIWVFVLVAAIAVALTIAATLTAQRLHARGLRPAIS
jgi:hypothetical protein